MPEPDETLPPPVVSPDEYDENYYREWCAGSGEWSASEGARVAGIYPGVLRLSGFEPGSVLVDIGTGRGELLAVAVEHGAERAIGIEYSPAAVKMANVTIDTHGVRDKAEVMLADARRIPVDDDTADLVTLVDVVEHLSDEELRRVLDEAYRILRPGGRVFVHTMPNKTVYRITYPLQRLARPSRWRRWPRDPRAHDLERIMHVNEQTITSLRRYVRDARFTARRVWFGVWVFTDFIPDERARRLYRILARFPVTRRFGAGDLFAVGTKPTRR